MESSKAFARCLHELQFSSRGCLRVSDRAVSSGRLTHRKSRTRSNPSATPSSSRAFTTSIRRLEYRPPQPAVQSSKQDVPTTSTPQQRPQARAPPAMDLSSISSNPNYKPPVRPQPAADADKQNVDRDAVRRSISRLLQQEREKVGQIEQRSSQQKPSYNSDVYGKGGSLSSRTTNPGPFDPKELFSEIRYRNARGGSAATSLTSDLSSEREDLSRSLRLKPSIGKTVNVNLNSGFDLTRAFQALEVKINTRGNAVRRDAKNQVFHVRRGQAKKIKRRERWRIMFKEGYLAECARVRKMVKQGW